MAGLVERAEQGQDVTVALFITATRQSFKVCWWNYERGWLHSKLYSVSQEGKEGTDTVPQPSR